MDLVASLPSLAVARVLGVVGSDHSVDVVDMDYWAAGAVSAEDHMTAEPVVVDGCSAILRQVLDLSEEH